MSKLYTNFFTLLFLITFAFQLNLSSTNGDEEMGISAEAEEWFELDLLKKNSLGQKLKNALMQLNQESEKSFDDLKNVLRAFFSSIPYYHQVRIDNKETLEFVLYSIFTASGIKTFFGRSDESSILIAAFKDHEGYLKYYLISCDFYNERPINWSLENQVNDNREIKEAYIKRKESDDDYFRLSTNGAKFNVILFNDDVEWQTNVFGRDDAPDKIDSRLKIDRDPERVVKGDVLIEYPKNIVSFNNDINNFLLFLLKGDLILNKTYLVDFLDDLFKKIPYTITKEKGFDLFLYSVFKMNGLNVKIEEASSAGRSDLVVETKDNIYIFELKYSQRGYDVNKGMRQMIVRRYSERYFYRIPRKKTFGIAISFNAYGVQGLAIDKLPEFGTPYAPRKRRRPVMSDMYKKDSKRILSRP